MNETIKKRLTALEKNVIPETVICLAEREDGTQKEMPIEEWYENRKEWEFKKIIKGSDPAAVLLVLADCHEEVADYCKGKGDTEGAERMTSEMEWDLSEYKRRTGR